MTMSAVKSYFSQTQVSDPKKSLGAGHRAFLPTLNDNYFNNNNGIFRLKEIAFVSIYRLGFGVRCIGPILKLKMVFIVMI